MQNPVTLVLFAVFGVVDFLQQKDPAESEFMRRGRVLSDNLAYSSELGVFAEDKKLLESSLRSMSADMDVAYVIIYGEGGNILASEGKLFNLGAQGFQVVTADNGENALAVVQDGLPALILLDLQMPVMDGMEFLRTIRLRGIDTPMIVVTAHGSIDKAVTAVKEGAHQAG